MIAGFTILYLIHFYVLHCNAHVDPGRRKQFLTLETKTITAIFKKGK